MESEYEQATSTNLPVVDDVMIDLYYRRNVNFLIPGVENVKTERGARATYGDDAVGYVQLRRHDEICTVKALIAPEHKVRLKGYEVSVRINESEQCIIDSKCYDCAASEGGCKHGVALLFWLYRRTLEPSVTSVECYWRKSTLSKVGSTIKGQRMRELFNFRQVPSLPTKGTAFLDKVISTALKSDSHSILATMYKSEVNILEKASLYHLCLSYKKTTDAPNAEDFISFCQNNLNSEICKSIDTLTILQSQSKAWFDVRYARITASKLHEVAHCKTVDGATTAAVLTASKFRGTKAMKRGLNLEEDVLKVIAEEKNIKLERVGMTINHMYPIFGASADAMSDKYCVEIKCPIKTNTVKNYITPEGEITPKPYAQLQLQMFLSKKQWGLFCVASPSFETDRNVTIKEIPLDENFCHNVMEQAQAFWKKAIFPILIN
ncbi:hypothetical protein Zmor_020569 [Zophobas morio]|uniref:YqaJ viral recombinase domain-containing protein n=1 Tax=Zophobas morio TaxID=2755281 RepID=A0AA38I1K8_9CUCU|nr:hypothetical protein Zmor_020569 [Zophobas morio]